MSNTPYHDLVATSVKIIYAVDLCRPGHDPLLDEMVGTCEAANWSPNDAAVYIGKHYGWALALAQARIAKPEIKLCSDCRSADFGPGIATLSGAPEHPLGSRCLAFKRPLIEARRVCRGELHVPQVAGGPVAAWLRTARADKARRR